jgi:hypothetical protein
VFEEEGGSTPPSPHGASLSHFNAMEVFCFPSDLDLVKLSFS